MPYGWTGKILDADLTTRQMSLRDTIAYALASRIAREEIAAGIDAYDPDNRIIIRLP